MMLLNVRESHHFTISEYFRIFQVVWLSSLSQNFGRKRSLCLHGEATSRGAGHIPGVPWMHVRLGLFLIIKTDCKRSTKWCHLYILYTNIHQYIVRINIVYIHYNYTLYKRKAWDPPVLYLFVIFGDRKKQQQKAGSSTSSRPLWP